MTAEQFAAIDLTALSMSDLLAVYRETSGMEQKRAVDLEIRRRRACARPPRVAVVRGDDWRRRAAGDRT